MKIEPVRVSDISSLLFCQRYCYFNMLECVRRVSEICTLRELYFSRRSNREDWKNLGEEEFLELYGEQKVQELHLQRCLRREWRDVCL